MLYENNFYKTKNFIRRIKIQWTFHLQKGGLKFLKKDKFKPRKERIPLELEYMTKVLVQKGTTA